MSTELRHSPGPVEFIGLDQTEIRLIEKELQFGQYVLWYMLTDPALFGESIKMTISKTPSLDDGYSYKIRIEDSSLDENRVVLYDESYHDLSLVCRALVIHIVQRGLYYKVEAK